MNPIATTNAPGAIGPYSQGYEVNGLVYTSGQIPVNPATGEIVGYDYAPLQEYRKGGEKWLKNLAGNMEYEPDRIEVVFLLGGNTPYKKVAAFYKNSSIGFRCCAYPEE